MVNSFSLSSFVQKRFLTLLAIAIASASCYGKESSDKLPIHVGQFDQQTHVTHTEDEGLPSNDVSQIASDDQGVIYVQTSNGFAYYDNDEWHSSDDNSTERAKLLFRTQQPQWFDSLAKHVGSLKSIRATSAHKGQIAIAAENGLFLGDGTNWKLALPQQGHIRWAPVDVRAVLYDSQGQLWFACPQGVGYRDTTDQWHLLTGADGLPYNDFTCMAAGPKGIWFGTTNGAIRYSYGQWEFRQGRRWLLDNHVRDLAVDHDGNTWFATSAGVSCIEFRPVSFSKKAKYLEDEIDKHHRRTSYGYVNPAHMSVPNDKTTAIPQEHDNDGHYTGLYLGATSLGYSTTKNEKLRKDAVQAFKALAFLSEVTAGGTHPAPKGFISRAIMPTDGRNPNEVNNAAYNRRRNDADYNWKLILPRWPIDASGKWYWKCDSSTDELQGHYFGFGIYYDHVCETEPQREEVRQVVRRVTDHLIDHDFYMIDHDGTPTRWGRMAPKDLNQNEDCWVERGLNSLSILTFLSVAHHVTGDQKYRDAFLELAFEQGYAMNGMTQPKFESGPGSFGQGDDAMAFMNYYHLVRYETDPKLQNMFRMAIHKHWHIEKYERNPFFNFIYAACCLGKTRTDPWGTINLSPTGQWLEDSIDTLKRYPLDRVGWSMSNAHRIDMVPLPDHVREPGRNAGYGGRNDGYAFRIDEQMFPAWGYDPWRLTYRTDGTMLHEGVSFMLAYYLGKAHGYIAD